MISLTALLRSDQRMMDNPLITPVNKTTKNMQSTPSLDQVRIERVTVGPQSRVVMVTDARSVGADRFRLLRLRLRALKEATKLRSVVITSPLPGDGKSTVTLNLATVLAEEGKRKVLVIEADLHKPTCASTLGITAQSGLAECLDADLNPLSAIIRLEPLNWYLLPAGGPHSNPGELLQSASISRVMESVAPHFDWILIDTPPLVPLTDALSLTRQVDGTLLVARADCTSRETIEEALAMLDPKRTLGIVLNGASALNHLYAKYSEYYGSRVS